MKITFDSRKNARNIKERGLPFTLVEELEWREAIIWEDDRKEYNEQRFAALLPLNGRLYSVVFTERNNSMRVISFRKANKREVKCYEEENKKNK